MITGLVLPRRTEEDPDLTGEGSIDPLGLAGMSDRLAEEIAPNVTARMTRIRFTTAMPVGASATQDFVELPPGYGVWTPWLAFEWHVVQALVRDWRFTLK